jgi:hypothetical protein
MMAPRMSRMRRWLRLRGMTKVTAQHVGLSRRLLGRGDGLRDPQDAAGWMQGRPRATLQREGGTPFTFVTGGIEKPSHWLARRFGGNDWPSPGSGPRGRQVIGGGLLEQLELHIAPVVPTRRHGLDVPPRLLGDDTSLYDVAGGSVRKLQNLGQR